MQFNATPSMELLISAFPAECGVLQKSVLEFKRIYHHLGFSWYTQDTQSVGTSVKGC